MTGEPARGPQPDLMGGPEPDEEGTDVMAGPDPGERTDVMASPEPKGRRTAS
jgi:hypothetical protein